MKITKRYGIIHHVLILAVIAVLGIFALVSLGVTETNDGQAKVISSNTYNAGTIVDGSQYTVLGYNITFAYKGLVGSTTITCPLYPVGSTIPVGYSDLFFVFQNLSGVAAYRLPAGCQVGGSGN